MAYDEVLAQRVRDRLGGDAGVTEKKMFGGLAFLAHGNMSVGVYRDGLLVRVRPDDTDTLLAEPGVGLFEMGGKSMRGWLLVAGEVLDDGALDTWIERGQRYAGTLPPK